MKVYVEAYYSDNTPMLGNLDGQGVIHAKNYKRTKHYKGLSARNTLNNKVAFYHIVSPSGAILETITNRTHVS